MMRRVLLTAAALIASFAVVGCTNKPDAERVLRQQGYSEIDAGGYAWLSCSKDDSVRTSFTAKAPNGEQVSGAVCGGLLFKNNTVRLD